MISKRLLTTLSLFTVYCCTLSAAGAAEPVAVPWTAAQLSESTFWTATSTQKFRRDEVPPAGALSREVKLEAARNEYENGQVVLRAGNESLTDVRVSISDLKPVKTGQPISSGLIRLYRQAYIETKKPTEGTKFSLGWYPDGLLPLNPAVGFDVAAGQNQGLWFTVKVPKRQAAGLYKGTFTVKAKQKTFTVPVSLQVWDFELTDESHTQTSFVMLYGLIADYYGIPARGPEFEKLCEDYYWFQVEYRQAPGDLPIAFDGIDDFIAKAAKYVENPKVDSFRIPYFHNDTPKNKEMADKLRAKGWQKKGYYYIGEIDEPDAARFPLVRQIAGELKAIAPDFKNIVTTMPVRDLLGYGITWCPLTSHYDPYTAHAMQTAGDHVWWYTANWPQYPYATYNIDDLLLGARILPWMQRKHKVEGNLYWDTTDYSQRINDRWVPVDVWRDHVNLVANGAGVLIYPNPDPNAKGPLPCIRLEAIRDGSEDYEYLWTFEEALKNAANKLNVNSIDIDQQMDSYYDRLFQALDKYNEDANVLLQVRREIAARIVALRKQPALLYTQTPSENGATRLSIYAQKGASVSLDGKKLSITTASALNDEYVQEMAPISASVIKLNVAATIGTNVNMQQVILTKAKPVTSAIRIPLNEANSNADLAAWTTHGSTISLSKEHVTQGQHSLKAVYLSNQDYARIQLLEAGKGFRSLDWTGYESLNFDVYNPGEEPIILDVQYTDEHGTAAFKAPEVLPAKTARSLRIPLDNLQATTGVTMDRIRGVAFGIREKQARPVTLFFDNFHFGAKSLLPSQDMSHRAGKVTAGEITIDGVPDEEAWKLDQTYTYEVHSKTENTGKFGLLWDDKYLYAAFAVTDSEVREPINPKAPWIDDSVELFIDGDLVRGMRNEHALQFIIPYNGAEVNLNGVASERTRSVLHKSKRTAHGYTVEMAVPWGVIGVSPADFKSIGITSHLNDNDTVGGVDNNATLAYTEKSLNNVSTSINWRDFVLAPQTVPMAKKDFVLSDFENLVDMARLTIGDVATVASEEKLLHGRKALKATFGTESPNPSVALDGLAKNGPANWAAYDAVEMEVFNPGQDMAVLFVQFHANAGATDYSHYSLIPGGESRRVRIPTQLIKVDPKSIQTMTLAMSKRAAPFTLYIDDIRLTAAKEEVRDTGAGGVGK